MLLMVMLIVGIKDSKKQDPIQIPRRLCTDTTIQQKGHISDDIVIVIDTVVVIVAFHRHHFCRRGRTWNEQTLKVALQSFQHLCGQDIRWLLLTGILHGIQHDGTHDIGSQSHRHGPYR